MKKLLRLGLIFGAIGAVFTFIKNKGARNAEESHYDAHDMPMTSDTMSSTPTTSTEPITPAGTEPTSSQDTTPAS